MAKRIKSGSTREEAANLTSIELVSAAYAHCRAFILKSGHTMVEKAASEVSPELMKSLRHLIELHAVDLCLQNFGDLLRVQNLFKNYWLLHLNFFNSVCELWTRRHCGLTKSLGNCFGKYQTKCCWTRRWLRYSRPSFRINSGFI